MKKRIVWLIVACLTAFVMILASCAPAEKPATPAVPTATAPAAPAAPTVPVIPKTEPAAPVQAGPQYGGVLTLAVDLFLYFDPTRQISSEPPLSFLFDKPVVGNWAIDRKIYDFPSRGGECAADYVIGTLAESWEVPDNLTFVLRLRKGVRFQDKPPVNGREFTADDLVWNLDHMMKSPFTDKRGIGFIETVKAVDKYTVQIKMTPPPRVDMLRTILQHDNFFIAAKESMGKSGEIEDWKNDVGTGPFIFDDFVPASTLTFKRNPNYWGYDEKNPKNKIPYVDTVNILVIPDWVTRLAGVRTGRIDRMTELSYDDAQGVRKTNTNLKYRTVPSSRPVVYRVRVDKKPFSDVRVRQALNMAINRQEMVKSIFGGYASPYSGVIDRLNGDLYTPYDKLPDKPKSTNLSVKEVLSYNPEKSKQLLAEAGYPNGFETEIHTNPSDDPIGLAEVLQAYLSKIGVQGKIRSYERGTFDTLRYGYKFEGISLHYFTRKANPLDALLYMYTGTKWNSNIASDPVYDGMYDKALTTFDDAARAKLMFDMEMYHLEQSWTLSLPNQDVFTVWQPWVSGYQGEGALANGGYGALAARIWVDQKLKAESRK